MPTADRKLRVFLCHASQDKSIVRELYQQLEAEGWIDIWVSEEREPTGKKDWKLEIQEWLEGTVVVLVCFSSGSITTDGQLRGEANDFLDVIGKKYKEPWLLVPIRKEPVLVVPVRLDACPVPARLKGLKWFDLFPANFDEMYGKLLQDLSIRGRKQEIKREAHRNREIRKLQRIANVAGFILKIRDLIEERPVLFRTKLRVFICYPRQDIEKANEIYQQLKSIHWMEIRLGEEQSGSPIEWQERVKGIVRDTDVILLCLSSNSSSQKGYEQPGFADLVDKVKKKSKEKIRIVPVRLDDFVPAPRFQLWRWLDYFAHHGPDLLLACLEDIARTFGVLRFQFPSQKEHTRVLPIDKVSDNLPVADHAADHLIKFSIPSETYSYWIAKRPVTCSQYGHFLSSPEYTNISFWQNFPKYDQHCKSTGAWDNQELQWIENFRYGDMSKLEPYHWANSDFSLARPHDFVERISWYEANAYCKWLTAHWRDMPELKGLPGFGDKNTSYRFRLPLRTEWIYAVTTGKTLPPSEYPDGDAPYGVVFVPHNFREWFANLHRDNGLLLNRYYGEMFVDEDLADMARLGYDASTSPSDNSEKNGFRVVVIVSGE